MGEVLGDPRPPGGVRPPAFPSRPEPVLEQTLEFLRGALPRPPATILDVGCGSGQVGGRLADLGYEVTGIDVDRDAVATTRRHGVRAVRADLRTFRSAPYDAVICVFSLHHMGPLSRVGAKLRSLVRPDGRLVVSDYAWEDADRPTAAYWFDTYLALDFAGSARPARALPEPAADPLTVWRDRCLRPERQHRGREMLRMLQIRFDVQRIERGPCLYGILGGSVRGPRRARVTRTLLAIERRRISDGTVRALGLSVVARRPAWDAK
jgi:SAM-dependent methyltransferase